jgi:hypothetical protein
LISAADARGSPKAGIPRLKRAGAKANFITSRREKDR